MGSEHAGLDESGAVPRHDAGCMGRSSQLPRHCTCGFTDEALAEYLWNLGSSFPISVALPVEPLPPHDLHDAAVAQTDYYADLAIAEATGVRLAYRPIAGISGGCITLRSAGEVPSEIGHEASVENLTPRRKECRKVDMNISVNLTISVDPEAWTEVYGDEDVREAVRRYVANAVQQSAAAQEGAITGARVKG